MRLKELISAIGAKTRFAPDVDVRAVAYDSRNVRKGKGFVFVAVKGEHADGHDFIGKAVEAGAICIVGEKEALGVSVPQLIVGDARAALSKVADLLYGSPSKKMTVVGVTGTNGKTTTTYLLESIFREAGFNPGVIGTVNYRYGGSVYAAPHTTPEAPELHNILAEMLSAGVTHCAVEVSSHALAQGRVADCAFRAGVFTNLTHEHLDYHRTMDEYYAAKAILFKGLLKESGGASVINIDDVWGRRLAAEVDGAFTVSLSKGAMTKTGKMTKTGSMIYPREYELSGSGIKAVVSTPAGELKISSRLVGEYNLQNILCAVGAAVSIGIPVGAVIAGVQSLRRVPGRLDKLEAGGLGFTAYVDYAHTADALERALEAVRKISKGRVITVFGCGGNRDRLKRPQMGMASARLSDVTIVTSDNPRDEDPLDIIAEIETGIKGVRRYEPGNAPDGKGYMAVPDRAAAIRKAVELARPGDTILVAGKGHEDYQIVKGAKTHFDDMEELRRAIAGVCGNGAQG